MHIGRIVPVLLAGVAAAIGSAASAQVNPEGLEIRGAPIPGGIDFQPAATGLAADLQWLDGFLLVLITVITIFVLALLVYCIVMFNQRKHPKPATFTHNTPIEVTWTIVPIAILFLIGGFSLPVLFDQQEIPEADVTVKVTGYQWYWGYEYPDHDFSFDSFMLGEAELADHGYGPDEFLLATDTAMVVPTGQIVVVQITAADVIHSWTIPAFGVKQDAVPGRVAQAWFEVDEGKEGIYFGQCSELCGKDHAYMPITVMAVTAEEYETWLGQAQEEYAGRPQTVTVAAAE
ncbi:MAG: cytochrome c oxidase subunit II [Pseudomonadota bacterium]